MKLKVFYADHLLTEAEAVFFLDSIPGVLIEGMLPGAKGFIVEADDTVPLDAFYKEAGIVSVSQLNHFRTWKRKPPESSEP